MEVSTNAENTRHSITRAEVAAISVLADMATEGPWTDERHSVWSCGGNIVRDNEDNASICIHASDDDNAFIAASRTAIPRLIDALEMAWEALEMLLDYDGQMSPQEFRDKYNVGSLDKSWAIMLQRARAALPQDGGTE